MRIFLCIAFFLFVISPALAQRIDSENSSIIFKVKKLGKNVEGTFSGMKGEIHINENDLSSSQVQVSLDPSTINTGNERRNEHLKSEDFFGVEAFPEINFVSHEIQQSKDELLLTGELTLHGVSIEVTIPAVVVDNGIKGNLVVDRFDYGVGDDIATTLVGSEVEIFFECVWK